MIDVTIQPFGRALMGVAIGSMVYQANIKQRNLNMMKQRTATMETYKQEMNTWSEMAFDVTSGMIDKRFRESKTYIETGGRVSNELRFKKTLSETDRQLQFLTTQNMLKARTKYEMSMSSYNQYVINNKLRASVKKIDMR